MRKAAMALAAAVVLMVFVGCASTGKAPEWVVKGNGAYSGQEGTAVYAVGIAGPDPNVQAQTDKAALNGRVKLARMMNAYVAELAKNFVRTHQDFFRRDETHASSVEFFEQVSKQVTEATLKGSHQVDSWVDLKGLRGSQSKDALYMLMILPLDSAFYDAAAEQYKAVLRQRAAALLKVQTDEALRELDRELEKARKSPLWFVPGGELMGPGAEEEGE